MLPGLLPVLSLALIANLAFAPAARADSSGPPPRVVERLLVGWELHYGYYLETLDGTRHVFPEFRNEALRAKFDAFFSNENLSKMVGKRPLCKCTGEWKDDRFVVEAASLYLE
jgi:hypothetical protein